MLWPWLPREKRDAILASGIKLVAPSGGGTGDAELDTLLEGFNDADRSESLSDDGDEDFVYVPLETSVRAIAAAVGLSRPFVDPWSPAKDDETLLFRPGPER